MSTHDAGARGDFATAVVSALKLRRKTQEWLAGQIDRKPATVSGWLSRNATRVPPLDVAFAIEDALGCRRGAFTRYLGYTDSADPGQTDWGSLLTRGLMEAPLADDDRDFILRFVRRAVEIHSALDNGARR